MLIEVKFEELQASATEDELRGETVAFDGGKATSDAGGLCSAQRTGRSGW